MDSNTGDPPPPPFVPEPPPLEPQPSHFGPHPQRLGGMSRRAALLTTTAGLAIGGFAGGYIISHAATSDSSTSASTTASTSTTANAPSPPPGSSSMPAHGTPAHENAETAVTGDNATKAQAAAVKYVGSGTAGAVTTDFTKTGYEVTVTKSDGSTVEVHLDSSFNVMHMPGPGGPGAHAGSGSSTPPN